MKKNEKTDLTGMTFGFLTVISCKHKYNYGYGRCLCKCICGNLLSVTGYKLVNKKVRSCGCKRKGGTILLSEKEAKKRDKNKGFKRLEKYKGAHTKHRYICKYCNKECLLYPREIWSGNQKSCGCIQGNYLVLSEQNANIKDKNCGWKGLEEYKRSANKRLYECPFCKEPCLVKPNHIWSGHIVSCGCLKYSKGELIVKKFLDKYDISYIKQYRNKKLGKKSLDFYLPELKIGIEIDGNQHNEPTEYFGGVKAFREQKIRDKDKNEICKNLLKIDLVRMNHNDFTKYNEWDKEKIEEFLSVILGININNIRQNIIKQHNKQSQISGYLCYMVGPMDNAHDHGVNWRKDIQKFLHELNVGVLNPTNKPTNFAKESKNTTQKINELKRAGKYDEVESIMIPIVSIDYRFIDLANFIIMHIDKNIYSCGTYCEFAIAVQQRKPILIHCEQKKHEIPNFLFQYKGIEKTMFDEWDDLKNFLKKMAYDENFDDFDKNRWKLLDFAKIYNI